MEAGGGAVTDRGLHDLPPVLIVSLCQLLVYLRGGSPRDVVNLALVSKPLRQVICTASDLWLPQCGRLGWSLAWLPLSPSPPAWSYFAARMRLRWRLRQQLARLTQFLDPRSRALLRPGAHPQELAECEAALQFPLPWELFETLRWANGQEPGSLGAQFVEGARLLSLAEVQCQVQGEHGPVALGKAFRQWLATHRARLDAGGCGSRSSSSSGGGGGSSGTSGSVGFAAQVAQGGKAAAAAETVPAVLLPFTNHLRGKRQFCMDFGGRVWFKSGFNTIFIADSMCAFLRGVLQ